MHKKRWLVGLSGWIACLGVIWLMSEGGAQAVPTDFDGWLARFEDVVVAPVERSETTQLVEAGVIDTDGFRDIVLCIGGDLKQRVTKAGKIGVVLVPDMYPFDHALANQGRFIFPIEVTADVNREGQELFESEQARERIAFPRYRVYVYNTTDVAAGVWIYAYRTR